MFVLEKESGDVVALSTAGVETRITVVESGNGRFILAIDAPPDSKLVNIDPHTEAAGQEQSLRANYRQELLLY